MTINLPEYFPFITILLATATLLFAYVRWEVDRRLKTQLATVVIATYLETLSRSCFEVSMDEGTWSDPEHPDFGNGQMQHHNEAMVDTPEIPNFETFEDVSRLGLKKLDRLMSLRAIQFSIHRRLHIAGFHDEPDYKSYFFERRLFYSAFGLIVAKLALDLRLSIRSKGMRDSVANERDALTNTLEDVADEAKQPEAWQEIYPKTCLYDESLYWPKAFASKD